MRVDVNSRQNMQYEGSYHHHRRRRCHVTTDTVFLGYRGFDLSFASDDLWHDVQTDNDWQKDDVQVASYV